MVISMSSGRPMVRPGAHRVEPAPAAVGMLEHAARHVGHAVVDGAPLALEQLQGLARLEGLLQHHAAAVGQDGGERVGRAEGPEERYREPQAVGRAQMLALADVEAVGDEAAVGERHALRVRRRSRRVEDVADVARLHRPRGRLERRRADARAGGEEVVEAEHTRVSSLVDADHRAEARAAARSRARPARRAPARDRRRGAAPGSGGRGRPRR